MSHSGSENVIESPATPASPSAHGESLPLPFEQPPKLKGCRGLLLKGLQRMSSSPSLAKMGRTPSSAYRSGGKGSMSCVSLSSSATSGNHANHSHSNSYSSQSSAGFSTAPTSAVSTPGPDSQFFDPRARIRIVGNESNGSASNPPTSIALPADLRRGLKETQRPSTPEVSKATGDYFSRPMVRFQQRRTREYFDFWGELPYEIKVQILRFLKPKEIVKCSAVSKSWHKLCFDGQLWISVDTEDYYQSIPSESLVKIMTAAGPFVRDLNLRGCAQMREKWGSEGQKISDACRNLEYFSLEGCRIDKHSIHYFLLRNPRLVYINVSSLPKVALNNQALKIIAQGCQQLEQLNVSWCEGVDTQGLQKVVQACSKLKELRAVEVRGFDNKDFLLCLFVCNNLERLVAGQCTDLYDESLEILMQGIDAEIDPLTDRALVPPRKFLHLDFSGCRNLTDKGIQCLVHHVPYLCGLQLSHCSDLTDNALTGLFETTPHLSHLDLEELEHLSNATLVNLSKSPCAPTIQHLNISYCESLGDTGMLAVLKSCPALRSLTLDNTRISDLVLTEAAAQVRARDRCDPSHRTRMALCLIVYDCQNVTWTGVREILSRNAEPQRKRIIVLKCFYGYQDTVNEHTKRVLRGDAAAAKRLERKWADYMVANEEAGAGGANARRRRRRLREAQTVHADEEGVQRGGRRRARTGGCHVM